MSITPKFYIEKYNFKTKEYEFQHPYIFDKEEAIFIPARLFPDGNDLIPLAVLTEAMPCIEPFFNPVKTYLPKNASIEIQELYKKDSENEKIDVFHLQLADLIIYCLQNPTVTFYQRQPVETEEGVITEISSDEIVNPFNNLKDRAMSFINTINPENAWSDGYTSYRIVFWIANND